jgi:hypothetical protein
MISDRGTVDDLDTEARYRGCSSLGLGRSEDLK